MWRRLGRHRVALAGGVVLLLFYLTMCLGAEFFATYTKDTRFKEFSFAPPSRIRVIDADGRLRLPFVYGLEPGRDPVSFRKVYTEDVSVRYPLRLDKWVDFVDPSEQAGPRMPTFTRVWSVGFRCRHL